MANTIKIKRKTTTGLPSLAQIAIGEGVLNEVDNNLTYRKSDNSLLTFSQGTSPNITSGTAAPSGGSDGDIYLQYT